MGYTTSVLFVTGSYLDEKKFIDMVGDLYTRYPGRYTPTPVVEPLDDNGTKKCGPMIYFLGLNYMDQELRDALEDYENWQHGTIIRIESESDDGPFIRVSGGKEGPSNTVDLTRE